MKTNKLTIVFFIISLFVFCDGIAQSFVCTGFSSYGLDDNEVRKIKKETLGQKINLTFYDTDVKITFYKKSGEIKESHILSKVGDNVYKDTRINKDTEEVIKLELQTWFGYINSVILRMGLYVDRPYGRKSEEINLIYKRE